MLSKHCHNICQKNLAIKPKKHTEQATIGPPVKHNSNGVSLVDQVLTSDYTLIDIDIASKVVPIISMSDKLYINTTF